MLNILFALVAGAQALTDLPADYRSQVFPVGQPLVLEYSFTPTDKAYLHVVNYPNMRSDLFFFHMHMTEYTSKSAGEEAVRKHGGTFMYLMHPAAAREVRVTMGGITYDFDPNRIFTDEGFKKSLKPTPSPAHLTEFLKFRTWVKKNIRLGLAQRNRELVIALHNNTDDDVHGKMLSIITESEIKGLDNQEVNRNLTWDIDNFYIATLKPTFDLLLRAFNPNASLRMEQPRNIGYLSNWMITEGIDYINVETEIDDVPGNRDMVEKLQELF